MRLRHYLLLTVLAFATGCSQANKKPAYGDTPYKLTTCVVTDNELGSMGDPVSIVHEGQVVKFCCEPCIKKFKANPEKYLKKLRAE